MLPILKTEPSILRDGKLGEQEAAYHWCSSTLLTFPFETGCPGTCNPPASGRVLSSWDYRPTLPDLICFIFNIKFCKACESLAVVLLGFDSIKYKGTGISRFTRSGYKLPVVAAPQASPCPAFSFTVVFASANERQIRKYETQSCFPGQQCQLLLFPCFDVCLYLFLFVFEANTKVAQAGLNSTPGCFRLHHSNARITVGTPTSALCAHFCSKEPIIISLFRLESAGLNTRLKPRFHGTWLCIFHLF